LSSLFSNESTARGEYSLMNLRQRAADGDHGFEIFYNVAVTPWCHITPDLQVITPTLGLAETSIVLGLRTKIDF